MGGEQRIPLTLCLQHTLWAVRSEPVDLPDPVPQGRQVLARAGVGIQPTAARGSAPQPVAMEMWGPSVLFSSVFGERGREVVPGALRTVCNQHVPKSDSSKVSLTIKRLPRSCRLLEQANRRRGLARVLPKSVLPPAPVRPPLAPEALAPRSGRKNGTRL